MGPDLGILWIELLPSGLYHRTEPPPPPQPPRQQQTPSARVVSSGRSSSGGDGGKGGAWKSANGLSRGVPKTPGGNVVETFLLSGNLVGAGGSVIYESARRGARRGKGVGKDKGCFVSLADQVRGCRSSGWGRWGEGRMGEGRRRVEIVITLLSSIVCLCLFSPSRCRSC